MWPDLMSSFTEWAPLVMGIVCAVSLVGLGTIYWVRRPSGSGEGPPLTGQTAGVAGSPGKARPVEHDPFIHGSAVEKRKAVRRQGGQIAVVLSREENDAAAQSAWVINRSLTGLRLAVDTAVLPGTIFNVKPRDASSLVPWVALRVIDCRQEGREWEIGCEFVRTPPASVLMLFG